jgi:hypothetical protein
MNRNETIDKLNKLKSQNLPRMSYEDIQSIIEKRGLKLTEEQIDICNKYLNSFVKLDNPHKCLMCEKSSYSWGLCHGMAYCDECGWQYRIYHYIEDESKSNIVGGRIEMTLQYHPDCFSVEEE